ncbi:MAG: Mu-like prophage major head subunit gpT family protein [Candidatus Brocadiia bacterium]|jgi:phage major head subunit gpT-like protein
MAVVNAATLEALWVSFNTIFQQTLERTKTRIDDIASAVPSSTRIEHYPVAALTGRMREWVKDRVIQDLAAFEASVRNLTFEHTIGVPREDIEDDVTGAYALAIQQQAALGVLEPWLQVQDELGVGAFAESVGFDGVPFFSSSHVWQGMKGAAGAPQSNLTTAYLSAAAVYAGIKQMSTFVGPDGIVLLVQPTHFLFSPALEQAVDQLFNVPLANSSQISQTLYGKFPKENQIKMPMWTGNQWMMLDCSKPIKPVVNQVRRPLALTPMVKLDDPNVFYQKRFDFGMDYRGAVKAIAWWLAYGSQGTSGAPTTAA